MSREREARSIAATLEVRDASSDGRTTRGRAAPFNSPMQIGDFTEVIRPAAFARTIREWAARVLGPARVTVPDRRLCSVRDRGSTALR